MHPTPNVCVLFQTLGRVIWILRSCTVADMYPDWGMGDLDLRNPTTWVHTLLSALAQVITCVKTHFGLISCPIKFPLSQGPSSQTLKSLGIEVLT